MTSHQNEQETIQVSEATMTLHLERNA